MPRTKILIVEDEAILALDMQDRLVAMGYPEPVIAGSGEQGVQKADEVRPDLVLMDIMLPGKIDGIQAAEQIRSSLDIPIIFLTAYSDDSTIERAKAAEPYGYIVKPFQDRELQITIEMALYKHEAERKLREARAQEAASKELAMFAYWVSHDLRAPLRSIDGFSRILLQNYSDKLDETGRDYLNRVRAGAQRMGALIDDILQMSRIARSELKNETFDLSLLARKIAGELRKAEPGRQVVFSISDGVTVNGDPTLMELVLENLMSNAWKFTSKHGQAKIEFGVAEHEGIPAYFVRDDGAGFDMAYVDKLFVPFQRLHSSGEFPGNGIGLAGVARIIHRHGGEVWAEGEVEKGAIFYFTLGQNK